MASTHAKLSPSAADRWSVCPGSVAMCEKYPQAPSKYASEGTAMHEIAAKILTNWWTGLSDESAYAYIGEVIEADDTKVKFDEGMAEAIDIYIDEVKKQTETDGGKGQLLIEVTQPMVIFGNTCGGTIDAMYVSKATKKVFITDLKTGSGKLVEVQGNKQLLQYACMVLDSLSGIEMFELCIVQPRACHADGRIRRDVRSRDFIRNHLLNLFALVKWVNENPNVYKAGDNCRWCGGNGKCPAQTNTQLQIAQDEFTVAIAPTDITDVETIASILDKKDTFIKWLEQVEEHALELLKKGGNIPGYKAVETTGHRKWGDEAAVVADLSMDFNDDQIYDKKLKSPASVEKLLGKGKKGKEAFAKRMNGFVAPLKTGYSIVPLSSGKREASGLVSAIDEFGVLEIEKSDSQEVNVSNDDIGL